MSGMQLTLGSGGAAAAAAAAAVAEANLKAMDDIAMNFQMVRAQVGATYEQVHQYVGAGGVPLVGILTMKMQPNQYTTNFTVMVLDVRAELSDGDKEYLQIDEATGEASLAMPVTPPGPKATRQPPMSLAPPPSHAKMSSFKSVTFGLKNAMATKLAGMNLGEIIHLRGTSVRAAVLIKYEPKVSPEDTVKRPIAGSEYWNLYWDAANVEKTGFTMSHLAGAVQNTGTSVLAPNSQVYSELDENTRYNHEQSFILSVRPPPLSSDPDGAHAEKVRTVREFGQTTFDRECMTVEKCFTTEANNGRPASIRAAATFTHMQLPRDEAFNGDNAKFVSIGIDAYEGLLCVFGVLDQATWVQLAPRILTNLHAKWFGYVDSKMTVGSFGGADAEKKIDFVLKLFPSGLVADLEALSRRIGIPVTADFVRKVHLSPQGQCGIRSSVTAQMSRKAIVAALPPTVPVTGNYADQGIVDHLLALADEKGDGVVTDVTDGKPEFFAWMNITLSGPNIDTLSKLSPEDGALVAESIIIGSVGPLAKAPGKLPLLKPVYDALCDTMNRPVVVVHAVCTRVIPIDVRSRNNGKIMAFMTGKADASALALSDAPAATDSGSGSGSGAAAAATAARLPVAELPHGSDDDLFGDGTGSAAATKITPKRKPTSTSTSSAAAAAAAATAAKPKTKGKPKPKAAKAKAASKLVARGAKPTKASASSSSDDDDDDDDDDDGGGHAMKRSRESDSDTSPYDDDDDDDGGPSKKAART